MEEITEALIIMGVLLGLTVFISVILCIVNPFVVLKRRIYLTGMMTVVSVSSVFSFYKLFPLPLYIYATSTVYIYWLTLARPSTRPLWFRIIISWPCGIYTASCLLMSPVCWVAWLYWKWLPLIVVGIIMLGFIQSMIDRKEYVYFSAATAEEHDRNGIFNNNLHRKSVDTWHDPIDTTGKRVLRIAQITDPHVGVWMSHERLRHICKTIAAWNPDLVFITGDIVTVESYFEKEKFVRAFEPLSHLQGRLYGCLGNHDYEAQAMVEEMLREVGVTLLKDEDGIANTPIGPVQIVGTEFYWERAKAAKAQKIAAVARKFHEKEHFRIWLVHNPGDFQYFPDGSVDLMFSGHTHGGQLGLQTFGIPFTFFWLFTRSPDYGLWQKGSNLLYVHRGTGYQGFPVRLGVDGELSLVTVFV